MRLPEAGAERYLAAAFPLQTAGPWLVQLVPPGASYLSPRAVRYLPLTLFKELSWPQSLVLLTTAQSWGRGACARRDREAKCSSI